MLYTVPPATVLVVRDVELYAATSAPIQFAIAVGVSGSPRSYVWFVNPLNAGDWKQWQGRTVLDFGQQLLAVAGASGVDVTASGYLLSGP